jgi:hypothetical protein
MPVILDWLDRCHAHVMMRKYQCFTVANYQFVDSDIVFLRNPEGILAPHAGFVTSCCHWNNPGHARTDESQEHIRKFTTTWPRLTFNAGQFACDRALFTVDELKGVAEDPRYAHTTLHLPWSDQPGLNLMVWLAGVPITNLTLPPTCMESTWAGDYPGDYESYWTSAERRPYLVHWAGTPMDVPRPINNLFLNYLTTDERREWEQQLQRSARTRHRTRLHWRHWLRSLGRAGQAFTAALKQA